MKLVRVDYHDITEDTTRTTNPTPPSRITEYGLLIKQDNTAVYIIKDYDHDGDNHKICSIPNGCILKGYPKRIKEEKLWQRYSNMTRRREGTSRRA